MSLQERIRFFEWVKNIPYKIGIDPEAPDYCCSSKSVILAKLLGTLGLETRQIVCTFKWEETPLPADILSLPYEREDVTHQFMQVFIPETQHWVNCDCTWDSQLAAGGFDIAQWDGVNPTILAIQPHEIFSPEKTVEYKKKWNDPAAIERHMNHCRAFYGAINSWMHTLRS